MPPFTPLHHLPSHLPHASTQVLREAAEGAALAAKGKPHTDSAPHPTGRDLDSATSVDLKSAVRRVETLSPVVLRTEEETLDKLTLLECAAPAHACAHAALRKHALAFDLAAAAAVRRTH